MHRRSRCSPTSRVGRSLGLLLAGAALATAGCASEEPPSGRPPPSPPSPTPTDTLGVPANPLLLLRVVDDDGRPTLVQAGRADVDVAVATLDDGALTFPDERAAETAIRFPPYTTDTTYPRAVITVDNDGTRDQFDPGGGDFGYGVDFRLDSTSAGRVDDNGNNLIQRGLSSQPSLFKLEVDEDNRPSCSVKGTQGEVIARADLHVRPQVWYRARCVRQGDDVTVKVGPVLSDGTVISTDTTATGAIGIVGQADPEIPISIGGKVSPEGRVVASASDQFNGLLRLPFVDIAG